MKKNRAGTKQAKSAAVNDCLEFGKYGPGTETVHYLDRIFSGGKSGKLDVPISWAIRTFTFSLKGLHR